MDREAEPPRGKIADFFTFTRIFHARRRRGTPRASDASCVSAVERPRERLPCRPPGRLRAGAPLQPASWPHRLSSLLSKLFPFIRAAAVGRSRPAESSTSLFDRLGVTSSTGTSQVSSAQRIPRRAAALLEKIAAFAAAFVIGPLFSPSTAAPSIHRLALTLVSDGACGFAGAGMLSASAARQFV